MTTPDDLRPAPRRDLPPLERDELLRYGRHLLLPEVGLEGQRRLKGASALIVGAGGLGSPLALYLAAAGVGRIGLVDFDVVDASNLQRQILHGTAAVGRSKLASARARLADLNPRVRVELHEARLDASNALEVLAGYDVVADGSDNFPTRYLLNDACALLGKPNVHGSIFRFDGQVTVFDARRGPCYRCLYPEPPPPGLVPSCAEGGVLGALAGVVGALQASETLKLLLGAGEPLIGRLVLFDALAATFRELTLRKDPDCALCGARPTITALGDYEAWCGTGPAREETVAEWEIEPRRLAERLAHGDPPLVVDVREPHEAEIARLDGALLIPLHTLPQEAHRLDASREIVLMCHHGARSRQALAFLRRLGFTRLLNLRGGIDAWSREVDPGVPRY
uniref:Molybdopterin-synthase adenylyltransferase MoeB n=1 Tax=Eiseniibacteriota bacterium TaxID=2212470 RepID=A0A832I408_UNCEI